MKTYKVIWFDDEYASLNIIKENASLNGIQLIGFSNSKEGIDELEKKITFYDAAIVDGKFYKNPGQSGDTIDDLALFDVAITLERLKDKKKLPWFILSGQISFTKEGNRYAEGFKNNKVYDKTRDEDLDALWIDVKNEADKQPETQIRHNYFDIFSVFSQGYLPSEIEQQVLELIRLPLPSTRVEIKGMMTNIRSIHESCLLKLEEIKVIPDSQAPFNVVIKHLSGNKTSTSNYQPTTKEYQIDAIENLNKWLYFTCGKYIHNLRDEHYNGYMISKYAVESLRNGMLELLLWFKKTYEENKESV